MKLSEEIKDIIKENDFQTNHLESEYNLYKNGDENEKRYAADCKKDLFYYQNKKRIYENMLPKIQQLEKDNKRLIKIGNKMKKILKIYQKGNIAISGFKDKTVLGVVKKWEEIIK